MALLDTDVIVLKRGAMHYKMPASELRAFMRPSQIAPFSAWVSDLDGTVWVNDTDTAKPMPATPSAANMLAGGYVRGRVWT